MKVCVNCGKTSPDANKFCLNCGTPLPEQPMQQQAAPQQHQQPQQPQQDVFGNQGGWMPPTPQGNYPPSTHQAYGQSAPGGSSGSVSIWGPFAGMGAQNKHDGWLMDGKGSRVRDLIVKVNAKFNDRQIPGARIDKQILQAKGLMVDKRPYFIVQREQNSVALYINRFGQDLYVSLTSFLKSKLSVARIVAASAVFLFYLISLITNMMIINGDLIENIASSFMGLSGPSGSPGLMLTTLCFMTIFGSIAGVLLTIFVILSVSKLITDKDILFYLRAKPDAFVKDDLMALEKAVEQTVKIAIDEIGLDVNDLKRINLGTKHRII